MNELNMLVYKKFKKFNLIYNEYYYLDYDINELTGLININKKVKYYTKAQVNKNLISIKNALYKLN